MVEETRARKLATGVARICFYNFLIDTSNRLHSSFLDGILIQYNVNQSLLTFIYFFLVLLGLSIKALVVFLIIHLLLRGFWIGTIGLRSVQENVDFSTFNYSDFFTEKLKKKVISLDNMVVMLDQICSIIFSFAFLIISMLLAFGLHLLFLGCVMVSMSSLASLTSGVFSTILNIVNLVIGIVIFISGFIYFIDYFTLGFFKKYKFISRLYYPFYRFYGVITLSVISRSIYYYLISKFSKRKIRIAYALTAVLLIFFYLTEYDQYQYYIEGSDGLEMFTNQYDNLRPADAFKSGASIPSNQVSGSYLQLFLRYNPADNNKIKSNCSGFVPLKKEGLNWRFGFEATEDGVNLTNKKFDDEDKTQLLECQSALYQVSVNDSIYHDLHSFFFTHPAKSQKGLITMLPMKAFHRGENILEIKKISHSSTGEIKVEPFTKIPFWVEE